MLRSHMRYIAVLLLIPVLASCRGYPNILMSDSDVTSLAWSPDGQKLAIGSSNGTINLWDIPTNEKLLTINLKSSITSLAWSPRGDLLASGLWSESNQSTISLWDVHSGLSIQTIGVPTPKLRTLSWSPNGLTLSAGIQDNIILLWDIDSGLVRTLESHAGEVFSLAWSPDGQLLAAGTQDGSVNFWDSSHDELLHTLTFSTGYYVADIAWSPDGKSLASASCFTGSNQPENCALVLWNPSNNEHLQTMRGDNYDFTSIAWSPTGQVIASAFMNGDVILFSPDSGERMRTLRTPIGTTIIAWSPDGQTLAAGSEGGSVLLWNLY